MRRYHQGTGRIELDLAIMVGAAALVVLVHQGIRHWPKLVYCFAKASTEPVRIRYVHATPYSWNRMGEATHHIHTASFERQDGSRLKLYITHEEYIMLHAGERGMLTRKGKRFVSFEPEK